jgi:WD40 repeat protein
MDWSESGDRLAVALGVADEFAVLDLDTMELLANSTADTAHAVAISPDGSDVAVISGNHLRIGSADVSETIKLEQPLGDRGEAIAFSHDGRRLAYAGNFGAIVVKECSKYTDIYEFPCKDHTVRVVFSPDDSLLATGHSDGVIRIWDLNKHALKAELAGHQRLVSKMAFSPDGRCLLSQSYDGTLRIWSVEHDRGYGIVNQFSKAETINRSSAIGQLSLSRDGRKLAIGCANEYGEVEVLIWKLDSQPGGPIEL